MTKITIPHIRASRRARMEYLTEAGSDKKSASALLDRLTDAELKGIDREILGTE